MFDHEQFIQERDKNVTPHVRNAHLPGGEVLVDVRGDQKNIQSNYAHEMAHKIFDYLLGDEQRAEWNALVSGEQDKWASLGIKSRSLSGDPLEDFPEAFSAWVSGDEWQHTGETPPGKDWRPKYGGLPPSQREFLQKHFGSPRQLNLPASLANSPQPDLSAKRDKSGRRVSDEIPKFGDGGIVTKPTLALIGEKGPEAVVPLNGQFKPGSKPDLQARAAERIDPIWKFLAGLHPVFKNFVLDPMIQSHVEAMTPPPLPVEMRHQNQVRASMARMGAPGGGPPVMAANALMQPPGGVGAGTSAMTPPAQFSNVARGAFQVGAGVGPGASGSSTPSAGPPAAPQAAGGKQGWDAWPIFPLSNMRPGGAGAAASMPSRAATPSPTPVAAGGGNPVPFGGPASQASADAGSAPAVGSDISSISSASGPVSAAIGTATPASPVQTPLSTAQNGLSSHVDTASTPASDAPASSVASQTPANPVAAPVSAPTAISPPNTSAISDLAFAHWNRGEPLPGSETPGTLENRLQTAYNSGQFSSVGAVTSEIESFHAEKARETQQNRPEALQIASAPPLQPGIATVGHESGPQAPAGHGVGVSAGGAGAGIAAGPTNSPQTTPVAQVPRGTPAAAGGGSPPTPPHGVWPIARAAMMQPGAWPGAQTAAMPSAARPAVGTPSIQVGGSVPPGQVSQQSAPGQPPTGTTSTGAPGSATPPMFAQAAAPIFPSPFTNEPPSRPVPNVLAAPPLPHGSQPPASPPAGAASGMGGGAFAFGAGTGAGGLPVAQRVPPDMNRAEMSMAGGGGLGGGGQGDTSQIVRELREMKKILADIKDSLSKQDQAQGQGQWQASRSFGGKGGRKLPDKPAVKVSTVPGGGAINALAAMLGRRR